MDINKSLRSAIDTGKVHVGVKQSCKAADSESAKLIIVASNCPKESAEQLKAVSYTHLTLPTKRIV